jgi:5-oxoprolinase (ATP-hydrolysing)
MPVHLGSMGASVRAVTRAQPHMRRGDSWLLNSPYHGGTHLPDMTVVTPVFLSGGPQPDFFVASRAHHADIGGVTPGSMPPFSRSIEEEGIVFECFPLVTGGRLREAAVLAALTGGAWPARRPKQNLADLRAQLAANARGIAELERAVANAPENTMWLAQLGEAYGLTGDPVRAREILHELEARAAAGGYVSP